MATWAESPGTALNGAIADASGASIGHVRGLLADRPLAGFVPGLGGCRSASSTTASETGSVVGSSRKVLVASVAKAPVRVWS